MTVAEQVRAEETLGRALFQYAGKWVAVVDHAVIQDADTLDGLLERIEGKEEQAEVFRVPENPDAACFY
jgi:hypothetical protein